MRISRLVSISVSEKSASLSCVATYDIALQSGFLSGNVAAPGQSSMTVSGAGLGAASYSMDVQLGNSICEATDWVSDSSVACRASSGVGG
eukprot:954424-Rhodomonas_salina.1